MRQKDMERFAFLYLCGQRDKNLLAGEERMTFQDFDRLVYITDVLGLDQMNLELWNRFRRSLRSSLRHWRGFLRNIVIVWDSEDMKMIYRFIISGSRTFVRTPRVTRQESFW